MSPVNVDILTAAEDLVITTEEVESVMTGIFRSATTGIILAYMVLAFAKSIGLSKKEQLKYEEMAREL